MKSVAFQFVVGAVTTGLVTAFGNAETSVKKVGSAISGLKENDAFKSGAKIEKHRQSILRIGAAYKETKNRLAFYQNEQKKAGGENKELARLIKKEESALRLLRNQRRGAARAINTERMQIRAAGQSYKELTSEYRRNATELDRLTKKQDAQAKSLKAGEARASQRQDLRIGMGETAAVGAALIAPVMMAARTEQAKIRLSTAINADDEALAMQKAEQEAKRVAKSGLATYEEAFDIQYALNSAGLKAAVARAGASVVAKVATVTQGQKEGVAEVLATTYNNLSKTMAGSEQEKINRIGDLLTKTQAKFQFQNFDQLGESLKEAASGMSGMKLGLEQGLTLLGQLNTAGKVGSSAGTALNAVLRNLGRAKKELGIEIVRDENGELDLIATLEQINEATSSMNTDERAQVLQDIWGDEGKAGLLPLLDSIQTLRPALKDVSESSSGFVDSEAQKYLESGMVKIQRIKNSIVVLGATVGSVLLPGMIMVADAGAALLAPVAWLADTFPGLTAVVGGAAFGFVALSFATKAGKYGLSMMADGLAVGRRVVALFSGVQKLATIRTYAFAFAQRVVSIATKGWAIAQRMLNISLLASPIGLVVAGVAALAGGAYLLINNWGAVKEFFSGLWDGIAAGAKWIWGVIKKVFENSPIGLVVKGFKAVASWFGSGDKKTPEQVDQPGKAVKKVFGENFNVAPVAKSLGQFKSDRGAYETTLDKMRREGRPPHEVATAQSAHPIPEVAPASAPVTISLKTDIHNITVNGGGDAQGVRSAVEQAVGQANAGLEEKIHQIIDRYFESRERLRYA